MPRARGRFSGGIVDGEPGVGRQSDDENRRRRGRNFLVYRFFLRRPDLELLAACPLDVRRCSFFWCRAAPAARTGSEARTRVTGTGGCQLPGRARRPITTIARAGATLTASVVAEKPAHGVTGASGFTVTVAPTSSMKKTALPRTTTAVSVVTIEAMLVNRAPPLFQIVVSRSGGATAQGHR